MTHVDDDFALWIEEQVMLLRERRFDQLDLPPLIEEMEGLVKNLRRELKSRLRNIMLHLLKWQYQPSRRTPSWTNTLRNERHDIALLLADNPSLRRRVEEFSADRYQSAVRHAVEQTGLPLKTFPVDLPYTTAQLLDEDYLPQA